MYEFQNNRCIHLSHMSDLMLSSAHLHVGRDKNNLVILAMPFKKTTGIKECLDPMTLKVKGRYSLEEGISWD